MADAGDGGPTSGVVYRYDRAGNRTTFFSGLDNPVGLAVNAGAILVAENGAGRIRSLPVDGSSNTISVLIPTPMGIDAATFDQSGFLTKFSRPEIQFSETIPKRRLLILIPTM